MAKWMYCTKIDSKIEWEKKKKYKDRARTKEKVFIDLLRINIQ